MRFDASGSVTESGNSVATAPGEMTVVRMLYGLTSWRSPSESAHRVLRRSVDGEAGPDPVAGHGRHVNEVTGLLPLHVRQRRANAIKHALDVDVDHLLPLVDL